MAIWAALTAYTRISGKRIHKCTNRGGNRTWKSSSHWVNHCAVLYRYSDPTNKITINRKSCLENNIIDTKKTCYIYNCILTAKELERWSAKLQIDTHFNISFSTSTIFSALSLTFQSSCIKKMLWKTRNWTQITILLSLKEEGKMVTL